MAIIKKYDKKNNTTYVYDSVSYWDKEKKQPRSKRKLIGKIDPVTGEIVPTGGRGRKPKAEPIVSTKEETVTDPDCKISPAESMLELSSSETADYKSMYEACRKELLEKEALIAKAESAIADLTAERNDLIQKLEDILRMLRR